MNDMKMHEFVIACIAGDVESAKRILVNSQNVRENVTLTTKGLEHMIRHYHPLFLDILNNCPNCCTKTLYRVACQVGNVDAMEILEKRSLSHMFSHRQCVWIVYDWIIYDAYTHGRISFLHSLISFASRTSIPLSEKILFQYLFPAVCLHNNVDLVQILFNQVIKQYIYK